MTKLSTQPYKGTRDYYPEDLALRNYIFSKWREVCNSFGYEEYDASPIEPLELFAAKTSEEIVSGQTFSFEDRGGRKITLRPEMTPTVSRMVAAKRQELGYPLRLFSIPNCFRYERMQRGRNREFYQLNADLFGVEGIEADLEIALLSDAVLKSFGAKDEMYEIKTNSRKELQERIESSGLKSDVNAVIRVIDAMDKMGESEFVEKLAEVVQDPNKLLQSLKEDEPNKDLQTLISKAKEAGVNLVYTPSLARGFDYYTDIVFEVFDNNPENNRSMFGGGRYDGLVGAFGVEPVPTVGFGMGDAPLQLFLESNNLLPELKLATDLMLLPLDQESLEQVNKFSSKLRAEGKNVAVDYNIERKLDKRIKAAEKLGIKQIGFLGPDELASGEVALKNL